MHWGRITSWKSSLIKHALQACCCLEWRNVDKPALLVSFFAFCNPVPFLQLTVSAEKAKTLFYITSTRAWFEYIVSLSFCLAFGKSGENIARIENALHCHSWLNVFVTLKVLEVLAHLKISNIGLETNPKRASNFWHFLNHASCIQRQRVLWQEVYCVGVLINEERMTIAIINVWWLTLE